MDVLVLSPPVCPPSEPPSGAFLLAAALAGHGLDAALLDLSLEFYGRQFDATPYPRIVKRALRYLTSTAAGYDPMQHRSETGTLHNELKRFSERHEGWRLTAMDIESPVKVHDPAALARMLEERADPFASLHAEVLDPILDAHRPKKVVISLAYLSQLTAAISLGRHLGRRGINATVGGSLPRSLHSTGLRFDLLEEVFPRLDVSNGYSLVDGATEETFLHHLRHPTLLSKRPYLSARPVIPLVLSVGCYWRRCMFCPDRDLPFAALPMHTIDAFLQSIPREVRAARPLIHLLDSAVPPDALRAFLPLVAPIDATFYGFARPEKALLDDTLIGDAAAAGCAMLQLGVEGGSAPLLSRFHKGIRPDIALAVLKRAAAAGIRTYAYLLFGLPGETEGDKEATLELLQAAGEDVDFLNLSIFNLPARSELTSRAQEFHLDIAPRDESAIHLYHPFTVDGVDHRAAARTFIQQRLLSAPTIRQAHLQTSRWFRAAHLAMMQLRNRNP